MGEAQQVKRPRTLVWLTPATDRRGRWAKGNKPRLGGVDRQAVLAESLRHDFHDALGAALVSEANHEVIRIADEEGTAMETRLHRLPELKVEHVMQEHVGKQGGNHSALERAGLGVAHAPVLHRARAQPPRSMPGARESARTTGG